ncbi:hypothetical protein GE061_015685 [Apolygus lucorum]|uniref:EGF-like domain-containing protein n=1 Tax=Apolygus lucorum TaxID=248454 RepID=A0A8S9XNR2_APOLU|nr:hypothetical protein GE061_015685 [Apolygus lucorum]
MLNQLSIFTPLLVFLVIGAISPNKECPCGYGGVCTEVNDIEDCKNLCGIIGKGWYNEDCVTVRNHCEGVLCPRGTCVTTFGGYFCKCPFGFTGVLCDTLWDPKSAQTATAPSNEIYVYYQIQPIPGEMKSFTVIYDVDELEFEERHTMLIVNISDGRFLYPSVKEMVRRNVFEQCIRETEQYPDLLDSAVCERLPKGSVLSFSFDPSVPKSSYLQDRWVFLPGFEEPIGSVADVVIEVQEPYGNGTYSVITIMKTIYRTFTYYTVSRDPFNCLMNFIFHGCANDGNFPTLHPRGTYIKLFVKQSETNCNGARITEQAWYMQRIKTRKYANNDPVPVLMEEETEEFLLLNPYFSYPGSYMFVVEYTIQGNPPHYGGTTLFRKSVHCFITTVLGNIQFRLQGGSQRTFSCTNPLEIPWENLNPNILLGEMDFSLGCDHLDDPECAPTKTKGDISGMILSAVSQNTSQNSTRFNMDEFIVKNLNETKMYKMSRRAISLCCLDPVLFILSYPSPFGVEQDNPQQ